MLVLVACSYCSDSCRRKQAFVPYCALSIFMRSPILLLRAAASVSSPFALRAASTSSSPCTSVPKVNLAELQSAVSSPDAFADSSVSDIVREAFIGRSSLGAISVKAPGFGDKRRRALQSGAWFALDPTAAEARNSCRLGGSEGDARVQPGWSGNPSREDHPIQSGFYCNLCQEMGSEVDAVFGANRWPDKEDSRNFKDALEDAGRTMQEVTILVLKAARHAAVSEARSRGVDVDENDDMKKIIAQSDTFLPLRLTYYDANHTREDTLVGGRYILPWHVDFNMATAFISAIWVDEARAIKGKYDIKDLFTAQEKNPERGAGLLLRNAARDVVPASIDEDCILIQLGAYSQLASGGLLRAGPHAVGKLDGEDDEDRGAKGRLTLGLFTYAPWEARMLPPSEEDRATVLEDDFGGLMRRAYTGDTVRAGFQSFADYMNAPRSSKY